MEGWAVHLKPEGTVAHQLRSVDTTHKTHADYVVSLSWNMFHQFQSSLHKEWKGASSQHVLRLLTSMAEASSFAFFVSLSRSLATDVHIIL